MSAASEKFGSSNSSSNFAAHNTRRGVKKSFKHAERVLKKIFKKL
jgi:hypothetical protein